MAVKSHEKPQLDAAAVVDGLHVAGVRPVTLLSRDYCTVSPSTVRPFGYEASPGGSVRQRLLSVVQPPEGLFGLVAAEVHDRFAGERHVGLFLSRIALGGGRAVIGGIVQPGEIVQIGPPAEPGEEVAWSTGVGLGQSAEELTVMHVGQGRATVFAAPVETGDPLTLPHAALWAPNDEEVFTAFTGKA